MERNALVGALVVLLLFSVASLGIPAASNVLAITDVFVTSDDRSLLLSSRVKGGFTPEVNEAIESGVPTTFTFHLRLKQKRRFWFDKEVASSVIQHQVKYDPLKKEFRFMEVNGVVTSNRTTKEPFEIRRWMAELRGEPIAPAHTLQIGKEYYVKMKVEVKTVDFSFPLKPLFSFLSFGQESTVWIESSPFRFSDDALRSQR